MTSLQIAVYQAKKPVCDACPVRTQCRRGKYGRTISRSLFQPLLEHVRAYQTTEAYKKAVRKRHVWVEPLFGEAKQWHGMTRFRLRRLWKVNIEGLVRAAGQNLKRFLKHTRATPRLRPAEAAAMALSSSLMGSAHLG